MNKIKVKLIAPRPYLVSDSEMYYHTCLSISYKTKRELMDIIKQLKRSFAIKNNVDFDTIEVITEV